MMHWVRLTTPEGAATWVNLAALVNMMRTADDSVTVLFLGGVTTVRQSVMDPATGQPRDMDRLHYAVTHVKERPEAILAMADLSHVIRQQATVQGIVAQAERMRAAAPAPQAREPEPAAAAPAKPRAAKSRRKH